MYIIGASSIDILYEGGVGDDVRPCFAFGVGCARGLAHLRVGLVRVVSHVVIIPGQIRPRFQQAHLLRYINVTPMCSQIIAEHNYGKTQSFLDFPETRSRSLFNQ